MERPSIFPEYLQDFNPEEKKKEAEALALQQEAELVLFCHVITMGVRAETPLPIISNMAGYIGVPQHLPATGILGYATPNESLTPEEQASCLQALLQDAEIFPTEIIDEEKVEPGDAGWISIYTPDLDRHEKNEGTKSPTLANKIANKKTSYGNKKFLGTRILLLFAIAIYAFAALKAGSCSPQVIIQKNTSSLQTSVQPLGSTSLESSSLSLQDSSPKNTSTLIFANAVTLPSALTNHSI